MPYYIYSCPVCGQMEVQQKMSEEPLEECPRCHRRGIHRVPQVAHVIYKAMGFTKTDKRFENE
jgi:putative FmdB family regulatory protein